MSARVLVVANDHVGSKMAGPGIRSMHFATELARDNDVTLIVPFATDLNVDGVKIVQDDPWDSGRMRAHLKGVDVVVAQKLPVLTMRRLARSETVAIYDLYAPLTIESLAGARMSRTRATTSAQRLNDITQQAVLATGDAFICASEIQRDMWLGALLGAGRIEQSMYDRDPSVRDLIDIVPFGIDPREPERGRPVMKGVIPGIDPADKVLLWGGGIWNWFDPLTVISAVGRIARERSDVRLYFMGLRHPNPAVPRMEMESRAVAAAEKLGLRDRLVFFNDGWVPYEERGGYYLEADLGVSAHFDDLETRFAFRTRLLDCFWARLPVVATEGDALGDLVREERLGRAVAVGDVDAWAHAITSLLDNPRELADIRNRIEDVRGGLLWSEVTKPLGRLVQSTQKLDGRFGALDTGRYGVARGRNAVFQHGPGAMGRALRGVTGRKLPLDQRIRPRLP